MSTNTTEQGLFASLVDLHAHTTSATAQQRLVQSCDTELDKLENNAGRQLGAVDGSNTTAYVRPEGAHELIVAVHPGRGTKLQSGGEFGSAVLPVAHFTGKWAYEMTLNGSDLMQIGWTVAPRYCAWSATHGTGDFAYTFAFDGFRKKVWNIRPTPCGVAWNCGDVITCLLDLEQGQCSFLQNGRHVHTLSIPCAVQSAYPDDVSLAYFPAFTLGAFSSGYVNYGEWPFKYVPREEGFNPIHVPTAPSLAEWAYRFGLLKKYVHAEMQQQQQQKDYKGPFLKANVAASSLLHHLSVSQITCRALYEAVVSEMVVQLRMKEESNSNSTAKEWLSRFVSAVYAALKTEVAHDLWCGVVSRLCFESRNKPFSFPASLTSAATSSPNNNNKNNKGDDSSSNNSESGCEELVLLRCMLDLPILRKAFGHSSGTFADIANLCSVKVPNPRDLEELFPEVPPHTQDPTEPCDLTRRVEYLRDKIVIPNDKLRMDVLELLLSDSVCRDHIYDFMDVCIRELRDKSRDRHRQSRRSYEVPISPQVVARVFYLVTCLIAKDCNSGSKYQSVRDIADTYMNPLKLSSPNIEKIDIQRLGGSYPALHRLHPLSGQLDELRLAPVDANPLLLKCTILYVLGVKERVMGALSDAALRHKLQSTPAKQQKRRAQQERRDAMKVFQQRHQEQLHEAQQRNQRSQSKIGSDAPQPSATAAAAVTEDDDAQRRQHVQALLQAEVAAATAAAAAASASTDINPTENDNEENDSNNNNSTKDDDGALDEAQQKEYAHLLRCTALDLATLFMTEEQDKHMKDLCLLLGRILDHYRDQPVFRYIPVVVLECFVDALHYLRRTSALYVDVLKEAPYITTFFIEHFLDNNKVTVDTSEYISVATTGLLDTCELYRNEIVTTLSSNSSSSGGSNNNNNNNQKLFQGFLMRVCRQFDHRLAWTSICGLLARFNVGNCFCCEDIEDEPVDWDALFTKRRQIRVAKPASAQAFKFYHQQWKTYFTTTAKLLTAEEESACGPNRLLQNLIDHANWSVSELGLALSEIKAPSHPQQQVRRTASVFDLTVRLLHIVEFVVEVGYDILFAHNASSDADSKNAIHTQMVSDLAAQCLTRFGAPGAIERVAALRVRSLENLSASKIIAAINGILHSMTKGGKSLDLDRNCFLSCISRPSSEWDIEQVKYCFGVLDWVKVEEQLPYVTVPKAAFTRRPEVVAAFEAAYMAHKRGGKLDDDDKGVVEDGLCPICAFAEINTSFDPCGHTSCGNCIRRHMMNSTKCFFCNKEIARLVLLSSTPTTAASGGGGDDGASASTTAAGGGGGGDGGAANHASSSASAGSMPQIPLE